MMILSFAVISILIACSSAQELVGIGLTRADLVWSDRGSWGRNDVSIWSPQSPSDGNWKAVGHYAQGNYNDVSQAIYIFRDLSENGDALATPLAFTPVWDDQGSRASMDCSIWRPTCPEGYVSLGDFAIRANRQTDPVELYAKVACVKRNLVQPCYYGNKLYDDRGSGAWYDVSLWGILDETEPQTVNQYFLTSPYHDVAPSIQVYCMLSTSFVDISI